MFIIAAILSVVLAVAFAGSGVTKATGRPQMVAGLGRLGVSPGLTRTIGGLELAAVAGLLIGLAVAWLGVAAALGLALLMAGAISYHLRAGDYRDPRWRGPALMPPALLLLAAATAVLRALAG